MIVVVFSDIGKDCERLVVTVQENNSQMIQMSLRATTINPDGCDRLLENGTKLWTDGRWKEEVISVKISTKQNQKSNLTSHEVPYSIEITNFLNSQIKKPAKSCA